MTVACFHEAYHFPVMPHYADLRHMLGEDVRIRVLTRHRSVLNLPCDPPADIGLTWAPAGTSSEGRAANFREETRPDRSPTHAGAPVRSLGTPILGARRFPRLKRRISASFRPNRPVASPAR